MIHGTSRVLYRVILQRGQLTYWMGSEELDCILVLGNELRVVAYQDVLEPCRQVSGTKFFQIFLKTR